MPDRDRFQAGLLSRARAEEIFGEVVRAARELGVADVEALMGVSVHALTRFANNAIHQNVAARDAYLSVRALIGGRTARATTNQLDAESIRRVVREAVAITRLQAPDPELLPLPGPSEYPVVRRAAQGTAESTPPERAAAVREAIRIVEANGQNAAGIHATSHSTAGILNSRGLAAFHHETMAQFSITAMSSDSSGWAKATACDLQGIDPRRLAQAATGKASGSKAPVELPPGRYTVILEPAAVLDLVGQIFADFSATAIRDERSFLTRRLGQKLFGANITIRDDARHALQSGPPFDGEGLARRALALVENGVVREVAYSRQAAALAGVEPTGHGFPLPNEYGEAPANVVIQGGEASLEEMIASTGRGILVTRFWYIREVDPYEKIMTGMTRDGTFLIEGGAITRGVRNFRFNQSLIELLTNVEMLSPAVRASGEEAADMVVPAMKVRDFRFSEVTRF